VTSASDDRRCGSTTVATSTDAVQTLAEVATVGRDALSRLTADQYVQFARSVEGIGAADPCFDYSYPQLDSVAPPPVPDMAPYPVPSHPPLPVVATPPRPAFLRPAPNVTDQPSQRLLSRTAHCVYCQQMYDTSENSVGSCRQVRLRNDLYCVGWGVKLYSLTLQASRDDRNCV